MGGLGLTPVKMDAKLEDEQMMNYMQNAEDTDERDRELIEQWEHKHVILLVDELEEPGERRQEHTGTEPKQLHKQT